MPPSFYLYAIAVLALAGGGFYGGYHTAAHIYQARAAVLQEAQDRAVAEAQAKVIAAQAAQAAATAQAEKDYDALKTHADSIASELTASLRRYAEARQHPVPTIPNTPAQPPSPSPITPSDSRLAELSGLAGQACLEDAAELTALQEWARSVSK